MEVDPDLPNGDDADQLAELLLKHLRQEISADEQQQLNKWIAEHPSHKQVFDRINNEEHLLKDLQLLKKVNLDAWWQKISRQAKPVAYKQPFYRRWFWYLLIAIVATGTVLIILFSRK